MKPLAFFVVLCVAYPILADIVHLNDGSTVEGTIKRTRDGFVITDAAGKTTMVSPEAVKSIELKKSTGGQPSEESLASLRRSVANLDDINQIIARYKAFVGPRADTPAGKEAQQDLAQWQDRLDKKMVKAGREWVTPERLAVLQAQAGQAAARALPLVAAGKMSEALSILDPALTVSPASGELLYLKGVILYRQSQLVPSRNAFQSVETQLPENAAAHNNVAVILWKTNAKMPALAEFDKAMLALPNNQTILDNVAEVLHALPKDSQKNPLTKRVVEHFNAQDAGLQQEMAQHGQYRWGSQWLGQKEYAAVQQQQKAAQDKLDDLKKQFNTNQQRVIQIAQTIDSDQQQINLMQQQQFMQDPQTGKVYSVPLPQRFYDLQRDQQQLIIERDTIQRQQLELNRLYAEQEKHMPAASYPGLLKVFGVEGIAVKPISASEAPVQPPAPATAPAAPATTRRANGTGGADY